MCRILISAVVFFLTVFFSGCAGRNVPIENLTIPLVIGIDLDDNNNLIFLESSPVFNPDAKENNEIYKLEAKSIRESRKYFDALATGEITAAKIQVLLIGKKILEHENWFPILDTVYRNPNFSINTKVVMVDGSVEEVIFHTPQSKPQTGVFLIDAVNYNVKRTRNVDSTIHDFHRQMYEKGITPAIARVLKKGKNLKLAGIALLNEKGKYVDTLGIEESSMLLLFQDKKNEELTLSLPIQKLADEEGIFHKNEISMTINSSKTKIKTDYEDGKFRFSFKIYMMINIVERLFPEKSIKEDELKKLIEQELTSRFENLIKRFQENKIDPIGLGIRARAFEYKHYKKVEDYWPEAFAEADVDISVKVEINTLGAIK